MIRTKLMIGAALFLTLQGCALTPTIDPGARKHVVDSIPTCTGAKECEIKWAAARMWVIDNVDMKIETYSTDYIQTYNPPTDYGTELAAQVTKNPANDGTYQIKAHIWCNNVYVCESKALTSEQAFNDAVNSSYRPTP